MAQCLPESSSFNSKNGENSRLTHQPAQPYTAKGQVQAASAGLSERDRQLSAYRYDLPESFIAQNPLMPRDSAKLLVVDSPTTHRHCHFRDLVDWLRPGDLLIINNTRVIPARLLGRKQNEPKSADQKQGAAVEVLLVEPIEPEPTEPNPTKPVSAARWLALVKPGRRLQPGTTIVFGDSENPLMTALIESRDEATKGRILRLSPGAGANSRSMSELIHAIGQLPLPPYITRSKSLPDQYQTIFAQRQGAQRLLGSVAAPTAGLHFTQHLLNQLSAKGIRTANVTLHVGIGTFRPVEVADIKTHQMHQERIDIPPETVEKIRQTKANGGRVIAVGTTSTRALEGAAALCGELQPYSGKTELFIYPGYQWQVVDGLITNFHLPESSLLMMVSALIGRERLMGLYEEAIAHQYRFYSFGDAMLILPEATTKPR